MEFYTLDKGFEREKVIDEFESAIWTERYSKVGDFKLSVPASSKYANALREGKFLAERDTDEVMIIETISTKDGILEASGRTLVSFFEERYIRVSANREITSYNRQGTPGSLMGDVVTQWAINPSRPGGTGLSSHDSIPGLMIGNVDRSIRGVNVVISNGTVAAALQGMAEKYQIGHGIYLSEVTNDGPTLLYSTYTGIDRTRLQDTNDPVIFSPGQDSLTNVKELRSIAGYKTCVILYPPSNMAGGYVEAYAPGSGPGVIGFDRRVLIAEATDINEEMLQGSSLATLMREKAADAIANNNYVRIFDGEVVPQPDYKFRVHYNLGDTIELNNGLVAQSARITEFIRSQDGAGEKSYPTVSIVPPKIATVVTDESGPNDGVLYG